MHCADVSVHNASTLVLHSAHAIPACMLHLATMCWNISKSSLHSLQLWSCLVWWIPDSMGLCFVPILVLLWSVHSNTFQSLVGFPNFCHFSYPWMVHPTQGLVLLWQFFCLIFSQWLIFGCHLIAIPWNALDFIQNSVFDRLPPPSFQLVYRLWVLDFGWKFQLDFPLVADETKDIL